jgi:hypothetical protein
MLDPQARLDAQAALAELRARHADLVAQEACLEAEGSLGAAEAVRAQREKIEEDTERLVGWNDEGEQPELNGSANHARMNVQKTIALAVQALKRLSPALGAHLKTHVQTGWDCTYVPDALWVFEV